MGRAGTSYGRRGLAGRPGPRLCRDFVRIGAKRRPSDGNGGGRREGHASEASVAVGPRSSLGVGLQVCMQGDGGYAVKNQMVFFFFFFFFVKKFYPLSLKKKKKKKKK